MKKLILCCTFILIASICKAQSNNAEVMEMIKQMQNAKGKIMVVIEGKTYTEKSTFFKNPKGNYVISTDLANAKNTFAIVIPKKESGQYPFFTGKNEGTVFVMQTVIYEVKSGLIKLTNSKGAISGTFTGQVQKFKGKPGNQKPDGDLIPFSGSFSGLKD